MGYTPFTDMLDEVVRLIHHRQLMEVSMSLNEALKGAPYGPTLNEVTPSELRGIRVVR